MAPPDWAYEVEFYDPIPDDEFICTICQNVLCKPVFTPCGHGFCKSCITSWLAKKKTCPICRQKTKVSKLIENILLAKNLISKLRLRCHNFERGCKVILTLEVCESHAQSCGYELLHCMNSTCTTVIMRKDYIHHVENCTDNRYVPCDTCLRSIPSSLSGKHKCNMVDISLMFTSLEWKKIFWEDARIMTVDQFMEYIRSILKEKEALGIMGKNTSTDCPVSKNLSSFHRRKSSSVDKVNKNLRTLESNQSLTIEIHTSLSNRSNNSAIEGRGG